MVRKITAILLLNQSKEGDKVRSVCKGSPDVVDYDKELISDTATNDRASPTQLTRRYSKRYAVAQQYAPTMQRQLLPFPVSRVDTRVLLRTDPY